MRGLYVVGRLAYVAARMPNGAAADGSDARRFERLRRLGAGGFGVVYEAIDRRDGARVALKALHRTDPGSLYRLKREFRALGDVAHPNLVRLFELISEDDAWFFTMELVDGVDLLAYVAAQNDPRFQREERTEPTAARADGEASAAAWSDAVTTARDRSDLELPTQDKPSPHPVTQGKPDLARLRATFAQLAEALSALHTAGVLHRDVKPANVLVTGEGRVVVLDFGIAAFRTGALARATETSAFVGTPAYMAPEQALEEPLTPATDWYAFGAMLFQALTGTLPFVGPPMQVLLDKQRLEAPRPSAVVEGVPADLDALCAALMQRVPDARPGAREVLRALGVATSRMSLPAAPLPTLGGSSDALFVGRAPEIAQMCEAFLPTRRGAISAVVVRGESGFGKTALVRYFLNGELRRIASDALVLEGRCYERESIPFKAFDGIIDALSHELRRRRAEEVAAILPTDLDALLRLFPVLLRVGAIAAARPRMRDGDALQQRARGFRALRELFARMCDRGPLVLFIDDMQWGDADSLALLAEISAEPEPPPLLLAMTERGVDGAPSPVVAAMIGAWTAVTSRAPVQEIVLDRLATEHCRALAAAQLGVPATTALVRRIADESAGNAFFLGELIRWALTHADTDESTRGVRLHDVIRDRLREMEPAARAALTAICLVGSPIAVDVALDAADVEGADRGTAMASLRAARFVRTLHSSATTLVEPSHDRIRESVVARLDAPVAAALHMRISQALRAAGNADPELLFVHFDGAGRHEEAAEFAAIAGDRAAKAFAFERAARLYGRALEEPSLDADRRREILRRRADALAHSGQGVAAADAFLRAAEGAETTERLELRRLAAEQLLLAGHLDRGVQELSVILDHFGLALARTPLGAVVGLLFWRTWLALRGLGFEARTASSILPLARTRADAMWAVALGLAVADNIRAAHFQARYVAVALSLGDPWRVCRGMCVEAIFRASQGDDRGVARALAVAAKTAALSPNAASSQLFLDIGAAGAAWFRGDWLAAQQGFERTATACSELPTGTRWEHDSSLLFEMCALATIGDFHALTKTLPGRLREATDRGDLYLATNLRTAEPSLWWLAQDDPDRVATNVATAMREWSKRTTQVQHWYEMQAGASVALYRGDPAAALAQIDATLPRLRRAFLLRVELIRGLGVYLRGVARIGVGVAGHDARSPLRARADARQLRRLGRPWARALAQSMEAGIAAFVGPSSAAARAFDAAAQAFDQTSMRAHAAACRLRAASLRGSAVEEAAAIDALAQLGIVAPERFARVVAPTVRATARSA
jgi:serine/threonine protein kinase